MPIEVEFKNGPLPAAPCRKVDDAGAVICFEGVVRPMESGRSLAALRYEAYEPMTSRELRRLADEVAVEYGLLGLRVVHSYGQVPVGGVSFRLEVASKHRADGLTAMGVFIDRLKREVPLWKVPLWAEKQERE